MSRRISLFLSCACAVSVACSDGLPTFPPLERDAGIECSEASPCATGETCIQGRCHPACTSDRDCASGEMCDASGVCVPRTSPRLDAGTDAGPMDPCDGVMCDPGVCHPEVGACVECLDRAACPGSAPICDISRGACRPFAPRACAPCNVDGDCVDPMTMTDFGDCVMRTDHFESVCAQPCTDDAECTEGLGFSCVSGHCLPRVGACFDFVSAREGRACMADADCTALGSTPAPGSCNGAIPAPDGGTPTPGRCRQPCGLPRDCPTGSACVEEFCVPM